MTQLPICTDLEEYRAFQFLEPGIIADDEIQLLLLYAMQADVEKQLVPFYHFNICRADTGIVMGAIDFRVCLTPALEKFGGHIGYEIDEKHRGHNYAAKAFALLLDFVRKHGLSQILITCGTNNPASMRTIENVGAKLIKIEETETDKKVMRPTCYYVLDLKC